MENMFSISSKKSSKIGIFSVLDFGCVAMQCVTKLIPPQRVLSFSPSAAQNLISRENHGDFLILPHVSNQERERNERSLQVIALGSD